MKHLFIFIFAFSFEIRVKASESSAFVYEPHGCINASSFCLIKSLEKNAIQEESFRFSFVPNTVIMRHDPLEWSLVTGQVFVKTKKDLKIKTPYGDIKLFAQTQAIVAKTNSYYSLQVLFGKAHLIGVGHKKEIAVLEGFENTFGGVSANSKSEIGIPKPIVLDLLIKDWEYHFSGDKQKFSQEVERFKSIFEKAKEELSRLNQEIVSRELASFDSERKKTIENKKRHRSVKEKNQELSLKRLLGE